MTDLEALLQIDGALEKRKQNDEIINKEVQFFIDTLERISKRLKDVMDKIYPDETDCMRVSGSNKISLDDRTDVIANISTREISLRIAIDIKKSQENPLVERSFEYNAMVLWITYDRIHKEYSTSIKLFGGYYPDYTVDNPIGCKTNGITEISNNSEYTYKVRFTLNEVEYINSTLEMIIDKYGEYFSDIILKDTFN